MNLKRKSCMLGILGVIILLFLDQFTKYLASAYLKDGHSFILIQNVFQLHYLENRGAAFGMMQGMRYLFVAGTFLMLILLMAVYWKSPLEQRYRWARFVLVLLTAGALGNLLDRLHQGYVIDFFYFELINFPIFNVADIYVTCGTILLILLFFFYYKEEDLEALTSFRKKKQQDQGG